MQKPLLGSVFKKYPNAEIHFLVQRDFQSAQSFFPEVKKFHYFERQEWSKWINQQEVPLFKPLQFLGKLIDELNAENFDQVWNWTHQKGSAYLMELISAREKMGLQTIHGQFTFSGSKPLKIFNDTFSELNNQGPHHLAHLAAISGIDKPRPLRVRRSLHLEKENLICLQPLTSDPKKNWQLSSFRKWISLHKSERPQDQIYVLGAPSEQNVLLHEFPKEMVKILNLADAAKILEQTDLLISTDTAIKHLAALCGTQILELAFGSAQPRKTGPWSEEFDCVLPKVQCWPCSHSKACSQPSHLCGQELKPQDLHHIVLSVMREETTDRWINYKNDFSNTTNSSGGTHVERN